MNVSTGLVRDVAPRAQIASVQGAVFWLCGAIILLLFTLGSPALNLVMPYTQPGGSFFAKFHPASWLSAPLLLLTVIEFRTRGRGVPRHLAASLTMVVLLVLWLALRGKGALAATFVDIHLTPVVLALGLCCLGYRRLRTLLQIFIALAAINVLVVTVEFVNHSAFLPRERDLAIFFRPYGLFAHPIVAGTIFYCAMLLSLRGVPSSLLSRPLMLLFLFGVALCGVRGPLALAAIVFISQLIGPGGRQRSSAGSFIEFIALTVAIIGLIISVWFGVFDRVIEKGLWEESAQSRFYIFESISLMSDGDFWNGLDGYDVGEFIATQTTGGRLVENAFISVLFQAGLPTAVMLFAIIIVLHWPAMRQSLIFAAIVLLVSSTTLGFGVKNMIAGAVVLTGHWIWRRALSESSARRS